MLDQSNVYAVVPARDLERAKDFYKNKLGLMPARDVPGGVLYECGGGTVIHLYETKYAGTAQNTALGWSVEDLNMTITELESRGVVFEKYDLPGADPETGIVETSGMRAIWFKDSEGNTLCLSQIP